MRILLRGEAKALFEKYYQMPPESRNEWFAGRLAKIDKSYGKGVSFVVRSLMRDMRLEKEALEDHHLQFMRKHGGEGVRTLPEIPPESE